MKTLHFLVFFSISLSNYSQTNMVNNHSFEYVLPGFSCSASGTDYSDLVAYWNHIPPWTCAEKKTICIAGVASSDCLCDGGHTGDHYARCLYQEYTFAPLNVAMEIGKVYYVEYYVKNGSNALYDGGLRLFENRPKQCGYNEITDDGSPHVPIPYATDLTDWTKVSGTVTADKAYDWIGLGNFNVSGSESGRAYLFDDIKIIFIGSSYCPDVNYIQNTYFQDIGLITYRSENLTISGNNIASTIPIGNVVVGSNALVEYKSETLVILEDGFSTDEGAYFVAKIAPCGSDCFPPVANAGDNGETCSGQALQLGGMGDFGNFYSWTANPSTGLSYLSNTNISNPTFTPPTTGFGTIIYTLTVSNECGQTVTDEVVISYDANPSSSPSVSVSNVVYSDLIEFDVNCGPQTAEVIIEVLTASGTLINTYNYIVGIDFTCCSFHWQIPNGLSPCQDYQIRIRSRNICSTDLSVPIIILNWVRNRVPSFTLVPNVFTPNNDGVNDSWCFDFTGAIQYQIEIFNPSGVRVYYNSSTITPPSACVWSAQCNQPACTSGFVSDGTYFYVLTITGCDGSTASTNGFISVVSGHSMTVVDSTQNSQETTAQIINAQTELLIVPNPNNGSFQISATKDNNPVAIKEIKVYDIMGKVIWENGVSTNNIFIIDITSYSNGIYYVKCINDFGEIEIKKLIKQ